MKQIEKTDDRIVEFLKYYEELKEKKPHLMLVEIASRECDCNHTTIYNYLTGRTKPKELTLRALSKALTKAKKEISKCMK